MQTSLLHRSHFAIALLLLLATGGPVKAVPLSYTFDFGAGGSGSFTAIATADAPVLQYNAGIKELSAFTWNVPGVGAFDLADLSLFTLTGWSPVTGLVPNAGRVGLTISLLRRTLSDTGVACITCTVTSTIGWAPGQKDELGGLGLAHISAAGSPCGPAGQCSTTKPQIAILHPTVSRLRVAAVPEPSSLVLAGLGVVVFARVRRKDSLHEEGGSGNSQRSPFPP